MIAALTAAAAVLLAVAGLAKLRAPLPAATMVTALVPSLRRRRPLAATAVRVAALGEVTVGVLVLTVGGRLPALALAAAYAVFTVMALRLASRAAPTSCGCFGRTDSPVGAPHVALNVACLAVAALAVVRPPPAWGGVLHHGTVEALAGAGQIVLLAWLGYLMITALPALTSARRLEEAR